MQTLLKVSIYSLGDFDNAGNYKNHKFQVIFVNIGRILWAFFAAGKVRLTGRTAAGCGPDGQFVVGAGRTGLARRQVAARVVRFMKRK